MLADVLTLITTEWEQDDEGIGRNVERRREIFATVDSVSRSEWSDAGRLGFNAEWRFSVFSGDYDGERACEFRGIRYGIYRTYQPSLDVVELYAERKAGE